MSKFSGLEWVMNPVVRSDSWLDFTIRESSTLWRWNRRPDTIVDEDGTVWPASTWCEEFSVDHDELVSTHDTEKEYLS